MAAAGFRATLLPLLCAACTTIAPGAGTFEGTNWRVVAVNGTETPPAETGYRVSFSNGLFHAGFGCNGMTAEYRVVGGQLQVGKMEGDTFRIGSIMATERDCSMSPTGHFEDEARAILQEPMQIRPNGHNSIVLMSGPGTIVLKRLP